MIPSATARGDDARARRAPGPAFAAPALAVLALASLAACGDAGGAAAVGPPPAPSTFDTFAPEARDGLAAALAAARARPEDAAARAALGRAYHAVGAVELALETYLGAARLAPKDPRPPHLRGLLLAASGRAEEAVASFAAAAAADATAPWPLRERARALLELGREAEALRDAEAAVARAPDDPGSLVVAARARRAAGDLVGAEAAIEAALRLAPGDPHAREYRRLLWRATGRAAAAAAEVDAGATVVRNEVLRDPWYAEVQRVALAAGGELPRIEALLAAGRFDAASAACRAAIEAGRDGAELRRKAGEALVRKGDLRAAAVEFERGLEFDAAAPRLRTTLASVRLDLGERDAAVREARAARALDAADGDAALILGAALAAGGDVAGGEPHLATAAELLPDRALVWTELGRARLALRKPREAAAAFERALRLDPRSKSAADGAAAARRALGGGAR